ncbi:uncharacterized protein C11orf70 homolog [Lingula anatina]|uniref:Cilia- and flagella-associated protein 300 n=1 Tax=Lingula anatina TaxID=7574 RepID=A0A1S3K6N3_LINAN|nr:uncharacterized protein C11orf70 homolog [Lingula anatina]|eukprot:XP_013418162.1 uncharacterized protein C11orf70 homolog [Lingula anatina]
MAEKAAKFTFQLLPGKQFISIDGKEAQDSLMKWGMKGRIKAQVFSFDQEFQGYQKDDFVLAFFKDPVVLGNLNVLSSSDKWVPLGTEAQSVTAQPVPCTQVSMVFFDRLVDEGIIRESGQIMKCFDDYYDDITVSDELRKMLLIEDSDNYEAYSSAERDEFLFRIFKHICLGGQVCQYEDEVKPYLDMTKNIYKDLVSVQKDPSTKELKVVSQVLQVTASNDSGMHYPCDSEHVQTFAYLIIDPIKRHVTTFYHRFGGGVF